MSNESDGSLPYAIVWRKTLPHPASLVSYSPDGRLFATCGENDRLVRIWFSRDKDFTKLFDEIVQFDFVYLPHPRAVTWFTWRNPGKTNQRYANN